MWPNPQETAHLVTFTEDIFLMGNFFCAVDGNPLYPLRWPHLEQNVGYVQLNVRKGEYFMKLHNDLIFYENKKLFVKLIKEALNMNWGTQPCSTK